MRKLFRSTAVIMLASVMALSTVAHVNAYSFNKNRIIDDAIFDNANSMSAAQIDSWLNNFPSSCISTKNGFSAPDPIGYNPSQGFLYGGNVSGGQVIHSAAQAYGLNPQVLIATLQKESSVVSGDASYKCQYINTSMGYGCPDSGSCPTNPATMSGFSKQVIHAAWLLKFGQQRSLGNTGWAIVKGNWNNSDDPPTCYGGPMTQGLLSRGCGQAVTYFDGYTTIDGSPAHMDSGATAALYWYTPHYAGNQSFFNIFTGWFGTPYANCTYPGSVSNGVYRLFNHGTGNQLLTTSAAEVCEATRIGWMYDGQLMMSDASQSVPVFRLHNAGRYLFTGSAAERDNAINHYGYKLEGVAFYGVNAATNPSEARAVYRLASPIGTYLYTLSTFERDKMAASGYRYEGVSFYLRENPGAAIVPTYRLSNPSGAYLFTTSAGERDLAAQSFGYTYQGVGFNAITQLTPITTPIYRLAGSRGYLLTTSFTERANAVQHGYRNEGVTMYTYGTMSDPGLKPTYRLARSGSYLYTTSEAERNAATQQYGFRLDGIGFLTP